MFQKTSQNVSKKFKKCSKKVKKMFQKNVPKMFQTSKIGIAILDNPIFNTPPTPLPQHHQRPSIINHQSSIIIISLSKHQKSSFPYPITPYSTPRPLLYHNIINDHQRPSIINHHHHQSSSSAYQNIKNLHPHTQ